MLILALACSHGRESPEETAHNQNTDDFDSEASKSLESEWISAAEELEDSLVSIDCVSETSLCEEYEVISYPAIRLFRGDESVTRYRGPRKASS